MGTIKEPQSVVLFASIIFQTDDDLRKTLDDLASAVGAITEQTPVEQFTHTTYYAKEMGANLLRTFVLFEPLVKRGTLSEIKLKTNAIEESFARNGKRAVNIDPGYIALEHVILATTKGYAHRVYLDNGIHADLTLMYRNGAYRPLEWTYPDYGEAQTISLLHRWREQLKKVLKCQKA
jgi:hypothetical protein